MQSRLPPTVIAMLRAVPFAVVMLARPSSTEFGPKIAPLAHGDRGENGYRCCVSSLTRDQLELLQRARAGLPMWGGSIATHRLQREVDMLLALRLVEPAGACPYRLTALGAATLDAVTGPAVDEYD